VLGIVEPFRHRGASRLEEKTVEYHVTQILGKLGIELAGTDHRRVLAVIRRLRRGD